MCLLELFVTATKLLTGDKRNKNEIRNEGNVLGRAVRVRWSIKNMTGVDHRPRTGDLKVCVVFTYQAGVVFRPWAGGTMLATQDEEGRC